MSTAAGRTSGSRGLRSDEPGGSTAATMDSQLPSLPSEIILSILRQQPPLSQKDLASCVQTSRRFYDLTMPILYHTLDVYHDPELCCLWVRANASQKKYHRHVHELRIVERHHRGDDIDVCDPVLVLPSLRVMRVYIGQPVEEYSLNIAVESNKPFTLIQTMMWDREDRTWSGHIKCDPSPTKVLCLVSWTDLDEMLDNIMYWDDTAHYYAKNLDQAWYTIIFRSLDTCTWRSISRKEFLRNVLRVFIIFVDSTSRPILFVGLEEILREIFDQSSADSANETIQQLTARVVADIWVDEKEGWMGYLGEKYRSDPQLDRQQIIDSLRFIGLRDWIETERVEEEISRDEAEQWCTDRLLPSARP